MKLIRRFSRDASTIATSNGWRLSIPAGDTSAYRFAQLDDYTGLPRGRFPSHPPLTISLRARVSSDSIPGTWGFGLWNDPFGLSLGFGGSPFRLPTLPNAVWFFHASRENWLSFKNSGRGDPARTNSGNGFLAQTFRSPKIPSPLLALAGIPALPFLATRWTRKFLRRMASLLVREEGIRLGADPTGWHSYQLEWSPKRCAFWVDNAKVLETSVSPRPPLGLVIWIDNQFAAFTPEGNIGFGVLAGEEAWMEVEEMKVTKT